MTKSKPHEWNSSLVLLFMSAGHIKSQKSLFLLLLLCVSLTEILGLVFANFCAFSFWPFLAEFNVFGAVIIHFISAAEQVFRNLADRLNLVEKKSFQKAHCSPPLPW